MLFYEMGLSPKLLSAIEALGYQETTPIQEKVIPILLKKDTDLIGLAQTGTGKTAAYGLPLLQNLDVKKKYPQILVLSPTRELCVQITSDLESFGSFMEGLNIVSVYGGASMDKQIAGLKKGAHIVVATPGRINDLIRRRKIDLSGISSLVLDEADEMLKMGFREDLDIILEQTPVAKNTLLFSATMAPEILAITKNYMTNPVQITIGKKNSGAENITHIYHMVHARDRYVALKRVVDFYPDIYGIVFCRTRQETKEVAASLMQDGYNAEALHGDLSQAQRDSVMKKFKNKNLSILVGTDVAARGLDVNNLTHVINYNLPDDIEVYTHRTGRTGRAGKTGIAVSIINMKEKSRIKQIEKFVRKDFIHEPVPEGAEICKRQLFFLIEKMKSSEIIEDQIAPYMNKVYSMLEELPKEEIIKRFVSLEFNRFLNYYKKSRDLNAKEDRNKSEGSKRKKSRSMSRILFNIGKGKNITKREIIDLIAGTKGAKSVEIGHIEIFKRASAVEVESRKAKDIIAELNKTNFRGIDITAEENYEFTGSDYRDRNKGPRGKKRKKNN